jgi:peptidoglycan/xylan/chitin deacetylase (PgdA/CDA1 family)
MRALRRARRRIGRWADRHRPVILLYHRVARIDCDPWRLAVPPDLFAQQVEALARQRKVVPLDRLVAEHDRGRAPKDWVAITFDDGYSDLLYEARPVLERWSCPATLFVTTGTLDTDGFWWDRLSKAVLTPKTLPHSLHLNGGEHNFHWESGTADGSEREALHLALWRWLRGLDLQGRMAGLERIEAWAGASREHIQRDRPLSTAELIELTVNGIFAIGAHGVTHAPLPERNRFTKAAEIAGSRHRCEEILGRPVTSFAYPHGELDAECREEVRRAGFRFACSTEPGPVTVDSPRFALPRMVVDACSAEELLERLPWGA